MGKYGRKVIVVPYIVENDEYERVANFTRGRLVHKKGDVLVSHGVCTETLRNIVLPDEYFYAFVEKHCYYDEELHEWVLND